MPDLVNVSQYDLPAGAFLEAIAADDAAGSRSGLLARLRDHQKKSRAALQEWRDLFDKLYEEAVRRHFTSRFWFNGLRHCWRRSGLHWNGCTL